MDANVCWVQIFVDFMNSLGHAKLMLCFTDCLPSWGDLAGWDYYEMICITKITMIA